MLNQQTNTDGVFTGMVCNAKCSFCIAKPNVIGKKDYFSFYSFKKIKKELDLKISKGINSIIYEGGEFSIHPEIFKILEYGQTLGIEQTFLTNGIRFSDLEFVKKLKKCGINGINFSIHAYEEKLSDKIIGLKGAFKKTLKGAINCNIMDINLSNNFVLIKDNLLQLKGMVVLSFKLNINLIKISMYLPVIEENDEFHNKFLVNPKDAGVEISKMLKLYKNLNEKTGNKLKIVFRFRNIGRCVIEKEFHDYDFPFDKISKDEKFGLGRGFYKKKECEKCIYNNDCPGFTQKYIDVFGDEYINPILK